MSPSPPVFYAIMLYFIILDSHVLTPESIDLGSKGILQASMLQISDLLTLIPSIMTIIVIIYIFVYRINLPIYGKFYPIYTIFDIQQNRTYHPLTLSFYFIK